LLNVAIVRGLDHQSFDAFFSAPISLEQHESDLLAVSLQVEGEVLEVRGFVAVV
jgi:hypothetical protein